MKICRSWTGPGIAVGVAILACVMCWCLERSISIEMPGILALGAVFLLIPLRSDGLASLQRIVCFYLLCIPINQLALQNMYIAGELHMSYSVPIAMLVVFGLFFSTPKLDVQQSVKMSWIIAVAIIAVHLLVLLWMLKEFYGYGYGHDLEVLGHISLYLIVFFMLWPQLGYLRCRQALGLVLVVFYIGMTIAGR